MIFTEICDQKILEPKKGKKILIPALGIQIWPTSTPLPVLLLRWSERASMQMMIWSESHAENAGDFSRNMTSGLSDFYFVHDIYVQWASSVGWNWFWYIIMKCSSILTGMQAFCFRNDPCKLCLNRCTVIFYEPMATVLLVYFLAASFGDSMGILAVHR